jgi:demethoxyubiquinone hydroxylase (CLK1/Coq7/Cat5 family)
MRVRHLLLLVLFSGLGESAFAQPSTAATAQCGSQLADNLYRFCYDGTKWLVDEPSNVRFTNRDRVEVEVQHLNYFRYTLSFDVQEQKSEAYQYLTKLWTSVLGVGFGSLIGSLAPEGAPADARAQAEQAFVKHLRELLRYIEALDTKVTRAIAVHRKPGLETKELALLRQNLDNDDGCSEDWKEGQEDSLLACSVRTLSKRATAKFNELERGVHTDTDQFSMSLSPKYGEMYRVAKQSYVSVSARSDQFDALAVKSLGSEKRLVGKREAGTRVTIHLAAVDAAGRSAIGDVSYFVETTLPLVVHGGMSYSRLNDVTFEKVKRAAQFSEEDLFQKTGAEANSRNFSLFMGWRVANLDGRQPNTSRFALLVSLGTDIDAPGKTIYLGPTLLIFNRVAVSYGAAFGKEKDGEQVTLEPDVFRIIKARPSSAQFFSISTRVF